MDEDVTYMHSLSVRMVPERTRLSCPSDIFTTSVALGSSAISGIMFSPNGWYPPQEK